MCRWQRILSIAVGMILLGTACVSTGPNPNKKKKTPTTNRLGYVMPRYNFSLDAEFNPRTARILPGYTGLTVAAANKDFRPLRFRPDKDKWRVRARGGKWHRALVEMQYEAPESWARLHPKVQQIVSYPDTVPPGYTQTFKVFIPGEHDLTGFLAIEFYSGVLQKKFTFTRY